MNVLVAAGMTSLLMAGLATTQASRSAFEAPSVLPVPRQFDLREGSVALGSRVVAPEAALGVAERFVARLECVIGRRPLVHDTSKVSIGETDRGDVRLVIDPDVASGYRLVVDRHVTIRAATTVGLAQGTTTVLQLLVPYEKEWRIANCEIVDEPVHAYRSLMVDIARRYHSVDELRQIIELAAFYKLRYVQLHLTDDQLFMFPSTAFPKAALESRPAYRREDLVALEKLATSRGISLVPELDVPGHATRLVKAYPQVFGSGSKNTGCVDFASARARAACKTLIDEMLAVFESTPYVHIGGDEVNAYGLHECASFKLAYARLGLRDHPSSVTQVLRDFIRELHLHVADRGRETLVWEGFHRDPAAAVTMPKDLIVVSWNGRSYRPDHLLEDGYRFVNASWDPYYVVDHYPRDNFTYAAPERIRRSSVERFGHFDGGFATSGGLALVADAATLRRQLLGAQMCWWEGRGSAALRMLRPRVAAFGAKLWNPSAERARRDATDVLRAADARLHEILFPFEVVRTGLVHAGSPYFEKTLTLSFRPRIDGVVRLTTDGSEPGATSKEAGASIRLTDTARVRAALFQGERRIGYVWDQEFRRGMRVPNLALGCPVTIDGPIDPGHVPAKLTDGVVHDRLDYWMAFPLPATAMIDLGAEKGIGRLVVRSFWSRGDYSRYRLAVSIDGTNWNDVVDQSKNETPATKDGYVHVIEPTRARYVRVTALGNTKFPRLRFARLVEVQVFER